MKRKLLFKVITSIYLNIRLHIAFSRKKDNTPRPTADVRVYPPVICLSLKLATGSEITFVMAKVEIEHYKKSMRMIYTADIVGGIKILKLDMEYC